MGWSLNWFRSGGGNGETVFITISDLKADIIKPKIIQSAIVEEQIISAKIEIIEINAVVNEQEIIKSKIE